MNEEKYFNELWDKSPMVSMGRLLQNSNIINYV